jgi:S-adenosylmethionine:tRNA ribosyltransferase-isomerase
MRLDDFAFALPREAIADHPCEPRDAARLLHIGGSGCLADRQIGDLLVLFRPGDLLVLARADEAVE